METVSFVPCPSRGHTHAMPTLSNPSEPRALALMREALVLLDEEKLDVAACHLSLAIETVRKTLASTPPVPVHK